MLSRKKPVLEKSEQAFNDQSTGGNPRYPLVDELKVRKKK